MTLSSRTRISRAGGARENGKRAYLTQAAGWITLAFGAVHIVVAPLETREVWSRAFADGWWNTFTLDKATTFPEAEQAHAFWVSLGSFGVPMVALGSYLVWATRHDQRVPGWLGWLLLTWAAILVTAMPGAPGWAILLIGALIVFGDKRIRHGVRPAANAV
ncbi:DUF6463 family protein [Nocardia altamirensis]|uniref:DUF6463 family protein n=1 Tax=Nocardia altamirensis TaxID=472158 RepID=UPI00114CF331|nr:DUF6463 family protein [Nocardia altamirensis]